MDRIKLAVIFGSRTCEHDVSIISALQLMNAANPEIYEIIPVYITREGAWYTGDPLRELSFYRNFDFYAPGLQRVTPDVTANACALMAWTEQETFWQRLFSGGTRVVQRIDVALPVMHGMNGEDGTLQGLLELANIPYTSSGLVGSSVGMDKVAMKTMFRGCGFPVLDSIWFERMTWERDQDAVNAQVATKVGFPCFVKPACLGSSIGITCVHDVAGLEEALKVAFSYDRKVLVEVAVEKPMEVNCAGLGFGEEVTASVCEMPVSWEEFLTFDEKYLHGAKGSKGMETLKRQIPAPIGETMTARVQQMTRDIFRTLDCKGVVRIDYIINSKDQTLYVNEINTIPGSLAYYLWEPAGISYAQLIDRMVEYALKAHAEKNRSIFAYDSNLLKQVQMGGAKGTKGIKG